MKHIFLLTLVALVLTTTGACDTKREKENARQQELLSENDSLKRVDTQRNIEMNDLNEMKNKMQEIIRQINEAEGRITTNQEGAEHQVIIENMAFIQRKMNEYRKTVEEMKQQLRNSKLIQKSAKESYKTDIEAFELQLQQKNEEIAQLREELAEKEVVIRGQGATIEEQEEMISDLKAENTAKEQALVEQDQEMHTAWYVFGTKDELKEQHILVKNQVMKSAMANKDYFTKIDIREPKVIKLVSKKVKLLTTHPSGSYVLEKDNEGLYSIRITKPEKFWSVSRYLVISVK